MAEQLRIACEETGFFSIIGHQVSRNDPNATFEQVRLFHSLPVEQYAQQMEALGKRMLPINTVFIG